MVSMASSSTTRRRAFLLSCSWVRRASMRRSSASSRFLQSASSCCCLASRSARAWALRCLCMAFTAKGTQIQMARPSRPQMIRPCMRHTPPRK
ncbi:MAG: hypothetical protein IJ751_05950 [Oscillospiraceae bacterium]|nr:hypothetical protein [Oscillospiraceae bacterium]